MLSLILKFLLAVLQALPQVLEAIQRQRAKEQREKRDAKIEKDPLGEFESKFGKLRNPSCGDCQKGLCQTETGCHKTGSPD